MTNKQIIDWLKQFNPKDEAFVRVKWGGVYRINTLGIHRDEYNCFFLVVKKIPKGGEKKNV